MNLVDIDGSQGEGGGQILRTSVSLSCILGIPVKISKIRAGRKEPGLRPQHLEAIKSAAEISDSKLIGAKVGSTEIELYPGEPTKSVRKKIDTRTAGSVTLIAQTLIPIGLFRNLDLDLEITGGTEVPASPTIDYLQKVVVPIYRRLGGEVEIDLKRRGYYPKGGGVIQVQVGGSNSKPRPLKFEILPQNLNLDANIVASSSNLPSHITSRETESAKALLLQSGVRVIESQVNSTNNSLSPGTSILIFRQNDFEYVGASGLGERGRKSEDVGTEAARSFLSETSGRPNLDSHLADMAVTLLSCIKGESLFTTSKITNHLETNLKVASKMTGTNFIVSKISERNPYEVKLSGLAEKPI